MEYQITYKITSAFITQVDATSKEKALEAFRTWESDEILDDINHIEQEEIEVTEVNGQLLTRIDKGMIETVC